MRKTNSLKALPLLVVLLPASLTAQELGDTVRVSGDLTAEFIRADSTGLHLSSGFVRYDDIMSLELKVGTRSQWQKGMLIGTGAGAGVGLVLTVTSCFYDEPGVFSLCHFWGGVAVAGFFAIPAGVVGTVVGALKPTDRFTPILLPVARLGTWQQRDQRLGLALGVRWRF